MGTIVENWLLNRKYVIDFLYKVSNFFHSKKNWVRYDQNVYMVFT